MRGALVVGGPDDAAIVRQLQHLQAEAVQGRAPRPAVPDPKLAGEAVRVAVDYANPAELAGKLAKTIQALSAPDPARFRMLRSQGVFVGRGAAPKVAFLYTGQGSQYVNMLTHLRDSEPIVASPVLL